MLPVKNVEIPLFKMYFIVSKWSSFNAPGSYTLCFHSLMGCNVGCPFHCMRGKGDAACGSLLNRNIFNKNVPRMGIGPTSPRNQVVGDEVYGFLKTVK